MKAFEPIPNQPDESLISLVATINRFEGISYQLRVNFLKKQFVSLEWNQQNNSQPFSDLKYITPGCLYEFLHKLYQLKIWKWKENYRQERGITIEKECWSIKLKTTDKVYISEGKDIFPEEWNEFCRAVEKLTGTTFR